MTDLTAAAPGASFSSKLATSPFLLALIAVLVALCADAGSGFKMLSMMGVDNDSQLRLVEVRDLMAGQGWFDTHQYRLGGAEGTLMHWSRLVDAPIAAIIWLARGVTGDQALAENVALVLWPALTLFATLYLLLRAVRRFAGEDAMVPAVIIAAITLYGIGIFMPGAIDHHNVQLALTIGVLTFLLESLDRPHMAFWAGVCATLTLAVGMETAGYVAFAGAAVALWFLLRGDAAAKATLQFGLGFAATALLVLVATKAPSAWFVAECDAFSVVQFAVAAIAGAGIAAIAGTPALRRSFLTRGVALGALGVGLAAVLATAFPQCLAAPYAAMDPRLYDYLLGSIVEAQPMWAVMKAMPVAAANVYPPIFVGLAWLVWRVVRHGMRVEDAFVLALLAAATLVSIFQLRGGNFALAYAVLPLAAMVAGARRKMAAQPNLANNLLSIGAWLISLNMIWMLATAVIADKLAPGQSTAEAESLLGAEACLYARDFDRLAAMPAQRTLAISNLGASILRYTPHHVFAGPYHRNLSGNLVMLDVLSAEPEAAHAIALRDGVDLIAVCRGNGEAGKYAAGSLQGGLNAGHAPAWLALVPETAGANLEIYRVLPN